MVRLFSKWLDKYWFHNTCVCDSSTNSYFSIIDTICNGLSITVGNSSYDTTGIYSDTLLA